MRLSINITLDFTYPYLEILGHKTASIGWNKCYTVIDDEDIPLDKYYDEFISKNRNID